MKEGRTDSPSLGPGQQVYQDPYQTIVRRVADFGAFTKEYFITSYGARAAVVVVRRDEVLLCRQYRVLREGLSWEIPGGKVDEGETPETAAIRECREETGVQCREMHPLIEYHPGSDIIDNPTHVFRSEHFVDTGDRQEAREIELPVWVPRPRCLEMIAAREIVDGLTVVSLLAYEVFRQRARSQDGRQ